MKNKISFNEGKMPKLSILRGPVYSLPVLYYINELTIPGEICSCHTTSVNRYSLDFICKTKSQMRGMGINIFREIIHPEDLALLKLSLKTIYAVGSSTTLTTTMRLKSYGQTDYTLFYCSKIVLETFSDGSVKRMLVSASDVTNISLPGQLNVPTPEELIQLKNRQIFSGLTIREKEVLQLIVNGMETKDIASNLKLSIETIRKHRSNLVQKTGVKNMEILVALAIKSWRF